MSDWILASLVGVTLLVLACAPATLKPGTAAPGDDTYAQVERLLTAKCTGCHGADRAEAGLRLDSWNHILRGSDYGEAIIAYDPENSLLVELATKRTGGAHPGELQGDTLSIAEIETLRTWIADGARSSEGRVAFGDARNLVYVCNQGEAVVSVIDADANVVIRNVDLKQLGYSPTAKPHHVVVEPGGDHWYVSLIGANRVLKFTRSNELAGEAEFEVPGMLVYDRTRELLYVGRSMSAVNPPQRIGVIDPGDMSVDEIDVFVPRPHAIAVSPDGRFVFTASLAQNTVVAVNTDTYEATLTDLGGPIHTLVQFAMSRDGSMLMSGGHLSGELLSFDVTSAPSVAVSDSLMLGGMPWHPALAPGGLLFVPNKGKNTVDVVDVQAQVIVDRVSGKGLSQPHGSAVSSDGGHVYVSNNNTDGGYTPRYDLGDNAVVGTVAVIGVATRKIVKVLEVENNATGVGAVPAG